MLWLVPPVMKHLCYWFLAVAMTFYGTLTGSPPRHLGQQSGGLGWAALTCNNMLTCYHSNTGCFSTKGYLLSVASCYGDTRYLQYQVKVIFSEMELHTIHINREVLLASNRRVMSIIWMSTITCCWSSCWLDTIHGSEVSIEPSGEWTSTSVHTRFWNNTKWNWTHLLMICDSKHALQMRLSRFKKQTLSLALRWNSLGTFIIITDRWVAQGLQLRLQTPLLQKTLLHPAGAELAAAGKLTANSASSYSDVAGMQNRTLRHRGTL